MSAEVVNRRLQEEDAYIGRGSPFGNPFRIGEHGSREQVIEAYRTHFADMLTDPEFKARVVELAGLRLGCYCKPAACHGDVIVEWLRENGYDE